jgi:hypothetical protein
MMRSIASRTVRHLESTLGRKRKLPSGDSVRPTALQLAARTDLAERSRSGTESREEVFVMDRSGALYVELSAEDRKRLEELAVKESVKKKRPVRLAEVVRELIRSGSRN